MKILFTVHDLSYADHISIAYLSAVAQQLGHSTYFSTLTKERFCQYDLLTSVALLKPDVVAYSINVVGFQRAVELNREAKKIHSFVAILGGPQATFSPETFSNSGMEAYCVGEGEYAFRDFLSLVEVKTSFDDVPNLITPNKVNDVRPLIKLEELPLADRDLVLSSSELGKLPKKTFYTSRGCPFQCAYCCNDYYHNLYRGKGPVVRRFSVDRVIAEIEQVKKKYRMSFVKFGDDCFALRADDWLQEFGDIYPVRIKVPFNCYLRLDTVDDNMLRTLKKAGCFSVHLSVDSTSRYVREEILKRRMRTDNLVDKLKLIKSYGINTWVNYMLAVPGSTVQDDLDTIEMSRNGKVTYTAYSTTVPMERTALYEYAISHKLLDPNNYQGDMVGCGQRSALSCFTEKEKDIRYNIYLLGALVAKLPKTIANAAILLMQHIPPNKVFAWIRQVLYTYYIEHKVFKLTKGLFR